MWLAVFSFLVALLYLPTMAWAVDAPGPWRKSCEAAQCRVEQFGVTDGDKPVLRVAFEPQAAGRAKITALAPLGISLRAGLDLVVDSAMPIKLPFERCTAQGCEVSAILDPAALESFVKGTTLTVRYAPTDALTASIPLKLDGLAAALNSLPR